MENPYIENCSSKHGRDYSTRGYMQRTCSEERIGIAEDCQKKLSSKGNTRRINIRYISMFKYSNQQHVWEAAVTIAKRTRPSCNAKAQLFGLSCAESDEICWTGSIDPADWVYQSIHPAQAVQPVDLQLCGKRWLKKKKHSHLASSENRVPYFPWMIYHVHPI